MSAPGPVPGPCTARPWDAMAGALDARLAASASRLGGAPRRTVVLVGPMGAGKTTVGRALAEATGMAFVDSDDLFAQVHGPIPAYFAAHGEPAFRAAETAVIAHVLGRPVPCVLASGGGAVLSRETRGRLRRPEVAVVYLQVGEEEALRRLDGGAGRPVLAGDPAGTWSRILAEREPLYREVADLVVETTSSPAVPLAWRIVEGIRPPLKE